MVSTRQIVPYNAFGYIEYTVLSLVISNRPLPRHFEGTRCYSRLSAEFISSSKTQFVFNSRGGFLVKILIRKPHALIYKLQ